MKACCSFFWLILICPLWAEPPTYTIYSPPNDWTTYLSVPLAFQVSSPDPTATFTWRFSNGEVHEGEGFLFTPTRLGTVEAVLTVTNGQGESAPPESRFVYVADINNFATQPSVTLTAAGSSVNPGSTMTITPQITDPDQASGHRIFWNWQENTGPIQRQESDTLTLEGKIIDGIPVFYQVSCIVVDEQNVPSFPGYFSLSTVEGNLAPSVTITEPQSLQVFRAGEVVTFKAVAEDPEGGPVQLAWSASGDILNPDGQGDTFTWVFDEPDYYSVVVQATDDQGATSSTNVTIQIVESDTSVVSSILTPVTTPRVFEGDDLILTGLAALPGFWRVLQVPSGNEQLRLEGNNPGRVRFDDQGWYWLNFQVDNNGVPSTLNFYNTRAVAVQNRDFNQAPVFVGESQQVYEFFVRNGSQVNLEVVAEDPEGGPLTFYRSRDGAFPVQVESSESVTVSVPESEFEGGFARVFFRTLVSDAQGKPAAKTFDHAVYVYGDVVPPFLSWRDYRPAVTVFHPLGETFQPILEVSNPDELDLEYSWSATYWDTPFPFFESTVRQIEPLSFERPGLVNLQVGAISSDGLYSPPYFASMRLYVYDPNKLPVAEITRPSTESIRGALNRPLIFESRVEEPNYVNGGIRFYGLTQISQNKQWRVVREADGTEVVSAEGDRFEWAPTSVGDYKVYFFTTNNLGLSSAEDFVLVSVLDTDDASFEPNDVQENAAPLSAGAFDGLSVSASDPVDWFSFSFDKPGSFLTFSLDLRESAEDLEVEVFQGQSSVKEQLLIAGRVNRFSFTGADAGTYFLRLSLTAESSGKRMLDFGISVDVLQPRLSAPMVKHDEVDQTFLTIVNDSGDPAALSLTAYDAQGTTLSEAAFNLEARGALVSDVGELFGAETAAAMSWFSVSSGNRLRGVSVTTGRDSETSFAEPLVVDAYDRLVVPHIAEDTANWYTRTAMAQTAGGLLQTRFESAAGDFDIPGSDSQVGFLNLDYQDFFNGTLPSGLSWGSFATTDQEPVMSGAELFGTKNGPPRLTALNLLSGQISNPNFVSDQRMLVFPHIAADTATFWTGIAFVNVDGVKGDVRLTAYNQDGEVLAEEVFCLEAFEKRVGLAQGFFPSAPAGIAWIRLESDVDVQGYELFGDNTGDNQRLAGFPAVSGAEDVLVFSRIQNNAQSWTGIAVVNLNETNTATLSYELFAADGRLLDTGNREVGPLQKDVALLTALFDSVPEDAAWLKVRASEPVIGFQLFGDYAGRHLAAGAAQ